jgi:hypothetical protein
MVDMVDNEMEDYDNKDNEMVDDDNEDNEMVVDDDTVDNYMKDINEEVLEIEVDNYILYLYCFVINP